MVLAFIGCGTTSGLVALPTDVGVGVPGMPPDPAPIGLPDRPSGWFLGGAGVEGCE